MHTNKLLATTFKGPSHCAALKPVTNNIGKQERKAILKKNAIKNINRLHQLDIITVCCKNNVRRQSIQDSNPAERSVTLEQYELKPCCVSFRTKASILRQ